MDVNNLYIPEGGYTVTGGPAHHEAPLGVRASFTHFLHAVSRPHLANPDLSLHLEMSRRPANKQNSMLYYSVL